MWLLNFASTTLCLSPGQEAVDPDFLLLAPKPFLRYRNRVVSAAEKLRPLATAPVAVRYFVDPGILSMNRILSLLRPSSKTQLGPLEQQLLSELWVRGDATVRELIHDGVIKLAYTTVMTTLDRLYKKGLLNRSAEGRAFRYAPRYTQAELERAAIGETIGRMLGSGATPSLPLSYLVEAVSEHDARLLDDLQRLLDQKRRELGTDSRNTDQRNKEKH